MNVVITGANRGIGLGFVQHYLERGHEVWATYRSLAGALDEIGSSRLHCCQMDVRTPPGRPCLDALPESIDILINNAGVYGPDKGNGQSLTSVTPEAMSEVFATNCIGPINVVQALWHRVARARGKIANISSKMGSSSDNASGGCYAYRASKAALVICSKSMAIDLAGHGITTITLHPGWVRTDMTHHSGLISIDESVTGMTTVIENADNYELGSFVAFDGQVIPY